MKKIVAILLLSAAIFSCRGFKTYDIAKEDSGVKIATGQFTKNLLLSDADFHPWYAMNYAAYTADSVLIPAIDSMARGRYFVIIMGTWCGDSKRQVPHLLKIFEEAGIDSLQYEIHGVDRLMKSDDNCGEKYDVKKVPTIIVTGEGKEVGRIVEFPDETLEKDLVKILARH